MISTSATYDWTYIEPCRLRVGELIALDVEMLDFADGVLMLPAAVQKDYPNDNSPVYTEIALAPETIRVLRTYLAGRWKNTEALFPSRSADWITRQGVQNMIKQAAVDANTLYDVTKRLRYATILTTERVYSHFDRV